MKVTDTSHGRMLHPQYYILAGRIRKRAIQNPRRERLMVRSALKRANIRYKEVCGIVTNYTGFREDHDRSVQYLDFVCYYQRFLFVLLFHPYTGHGLKPYEKRTFDSKKQYLIDKGVPFLVLKRNETTQVYQILITRFIGKERQIQARQKENPMYERAAIERIAEGNEGRNKS